MKFFPPESLTITTHLNSEQVQQKLSELLSSTTTTSFNKIYEGKISDNDFICKRIRKIGSRQVRLISEGKIYEREGGCLITIKMTLSDSDEPSRKNPLLLSMIFMMLIVVGGMLEFNPIKWTIAGGTWLGFCYLFLINDFKQEAEREKAVFYQLFSSKY